MTHIPRAVVSIAERAIVKAVRRVMPDIITGETLFVEHLENSRRLNNSEAHITVHH